MQGSSIGTCMCAVKAAKHFYTWLLHFRGYIDVLTLIHAYFYFWYGRYMVTSFAISCTLVPFLNAY